MSQSFGPINTIYKKVKLKNIPQLSPNIVYFSEIKKYTLQKLKNILFPCFFLGVVSDSDTTLYPGQKRHSPMKKKRHIKGYHTGCAPAILSFN
jgi:hypothetical protein